MTQPLLVFLIGAGGGFLSGLLGLGGAIFMIPLLLYVPPLLGVGLLDTRTVAAVSMVQVLAAPLTGVLVHNKNRFTPVRELFPMILEAKIPLDLCGACAKTYEIGPDDLVPGVKIITLPTLALEMPSRETITL